MLLFIIAYDPLIKIISSSLGPRAICHFAYCDDLAIAPMDLCGAWLQLVRLFKIIRMISLLEMNAGTTQFCIVCESTCIIVAADMVAVHPCLTLEQFKPHFKYLGIFLGRDVQDLNWSAPLESYCEAVNFVRNLECGFCTTNSLYNILCMSKLSFVGQFFPPTPSVLRRENWGIQVIQKGPWNAIPSNIMAKLVSVSMPFEVLRIADTSKASMVRCALVTCQVFTEAMQEITNARGRDTAVLATLATGLRPYCFLDTWSVVCAEYNALLSEHERPLDIALFKQKVVLAKFRELVQFDWSSFLSKRLSKLFEEGFEHRVVDIPTIYSHNKTRLGPKVISTHFRTLCNHWCSRSRFGLDSGICPFCCRECDDSLAHCLMCPIFRSVYKRVLYMPLSLQSLESLLLFMHEDHPLSTQDCSRAIFDVYVFFISFNACRNGKNFELRLMRFIIKHLLVKKPRLRAFLLRKANNTG